MYAGLSIELRQREFGIRVHRIQPRHTDHSSFSCVGWFCFSSLPPFPQREDDSYQACAIYPSLSQSSSVITTLVYLKLPDTAQWLCMYCVDIHSHSHSFIHTVQTCIHLQSIALRLRQRSKWHRIILSRFVFPSACPPPPPLPSCLLGVYLYSIIFLIPPSSFCCLSFLLLLSLFLSFVPIVRCILDQQRCLNSERAYMHTVSPFW